MYNFVQWATYKSAVGGKKETELFLPSDEPILKLVPVASFENEVIRMKF